MSLKVPDDLNEILIQSGVDTALRSKIMKEAESLEADKKAEKSSNFGPKAKNKFVIMVRGDKTLADKVQQGWIIKVKENDDTNTLVERIKNAAKEQNVNGRKKSIVNTFADVFKYLKRKFSKAHNWQPVTKEPAQVIVLEHEHINE